MFKFQKQVSLLYLFLIFVLLLFLFSLQECYCVRQKLSENFLYVTETPYGISIENEDSYITIGAMILELLKAGKDDFFLVKHGVDPDALEKLLSKHDAGVQGGMHRWDNDVFPQYYKVDNDRVLRLYADLTGQTIRQLPYQE